MNRANNTRGFTLVEVMIVVVIISILAAIAYPSYVNQVRKSRRAEAKSLLLRAANSQERFYSTTSPNSYATNMAALGYSTNAAGKALSGETGNAGEAWYAVSVMSAANAAAVTGAACPIATCYVLQAEPLRDQANDTKCATLRVDSLDRRYTTGTSPAGECW